MSDGALRETNDFERAVRRALEPIRSADSGLHHDLTCTLDTFTNVLRDAARAGHAINPSEWVGLPLGPAEGA